MPRRSYEDDFEYNDNEFEENRRGIRKLKKEIETAEKKKQWERESYYNSDHDYDERR